MLAKILLLLILAAIVVSLATALYHLVRDADDSKRIVRALTWRTLLSVILFLLLLLAFRFGLIKPHGGGFAVPSSVAAHHQ